MLNAVPNANENNNTNWAKMWRILTFITMLLVAKEIHCDYVKFFSKYRKLAVMAFCVLLKFEEKILEMATSNGNFNNILDKFKFALQFFGWQLFPIYWNLCVKMPTLCISKKKLEC